MLMENHSFNLTNIKIIFLSSVGWICDISLSDIIVKLRLLCSELFWIETRIFLIDKYRGNVLNVSQVLWLTRHCIKQSRERAPTVVIPFRKQLSDKSEILNYQINFGMKITWCGLWKESNYEQYIFFPFWGGWIRC